MSVERDLVNAIDLIKGYDVNKREYHSVKIFTSFSLKHFKKHKLEGKNVLLKLRSYDQVADMLSYGANITCYSTNKFDEYFLKLFLESLKLSYEEHFNFFKYDYGNIGKTFNREIYNKIKDNLSDDVRYFFDELYNKFSSRKMLNSKLIYISKYSYKQSEMYIRYFLRAKYNNLRNRLNECKIEYINMDSDTALDMFKDESFNFIDFSYNLNKLNKDKFKEKLEKIEKSLKILKSNGKIQGFVGRNSEIILPNFKRIETRSLIDSNTNSKDCKKDYAYVYTKINNIDKQ